MTEGRGASLVRFDGRPVLVTGAGIVEVLAEGGASVVVADIDEDCANAHAEALTPKR